MDDLISRQAAIDALRTCYETETISINNGDEYINYGDAVAEIEQLSSAQPEVTEEEVKEYCRKRCLCIVDSALLKKYTSVQPEQKKGKWIKYEQRFMLGESLETVQKTVRECSVCGAKIAGMVGIMNFCPNCGADMREENNG